MHVSKKLRVLSAVAALALVATACGDDEPEGGETGSPTGGETATASGPQDFVDIQNFASGEPDHIDPGLSGVIQGAQISTLVYDGLVEYDYSAATPELIGVVAESWESPDEGLTWVFTLKDDQVFSDGSPVLASSFVDAWNLVVSPDYASEISYHFLPIQGASEVLEGEAETMSGVVADDEAGTITITLDDPFAEWPAVVSHTVFSPKTPDDVAAGVNLEQGVMTGNGPYKMSGPWENEVRITLERNDLWGGGIAGAGTQATLDTIEFKISKDIDSAYADFEAGNGMTAAIPSGRFAEATGNYPNATDAVLGIYHFFVNQESQLGGEENRLLREAISLAIDRDAINAAVYDGSRVNATSMTPPGVAGYVEGLCPVCHTDPVEAQVKFDEWEAAGGSLDDPIILNFNSGSGHEDVVAIIQQNLEALGLETPVLDGRDPTTYFTEMRNGDCELCRAGWIWDYPSFDNAAYALFHSSAIDGDNIGRINNPDIDAALDEARGTLDNEARYALYQEAERLALEDLALIPINWYAGNIVYDESVQNFVLTPGFFVLYENVTIAN